MRYKHEFCTVDGCSNKHAAVGYCNAHYGRWRRHGDPLTGRTPDGKPERFYREVVLAYDGDECLPWPFGKDRNGYGVMRHEGRMQLVSRLVCEEVNGHPPTPKHEAAHDCGKGHLSCCTKRHLSWKTHQENLADRVPHGTHNRGERHGSAKLTEAKVREILALGGRLSQREIGKIFGVNQSQINRIQRSQAWAHLRSS
jgi:hypothetical protein